MNNRLDETLDHVAEEVFESLAFVLPAFEDEESLPPAGAIRTAASISFAGPFEGTLAQDEKSCVVFGMPKEAIGLDAAEQVVPLNAMAGRIIETLSRSRAPATARGQ